MLKMKSFNAMLNIDGVRYSFRSSGLIKIAHITSKFNTDPIILKGMYPMPNMMDSVGVKTKLGSVERTIGIVEEGSTCNQH